MSPAAVPGAAAHAAPVSLQASCAERRLSFAEASTIVPEGQPGRFCAHVSPAWTFSGKPNGGYLLSMMARAALVLSSHEHVLAASAHYLRSPDPGPVTIEAELLRAGRSASQLHARISQDQRTCAEALPTAGQIDTSADPYWDQGAPAVAGEDYQDCPRLAPELPDGKRVEILEQIEVRLDPASLGFVTGHPSGKGELRGWLALPLDEQFDPVSLLFAVDAYPAATFDIEYSGWVPTLELTAYIRALPAPGPLRVLQRALLVSAQRVDEESTVWDSEGRLVAQARQLASVRLG